MINKELMDYLNKEVIPKYQRLDLAHREDHVKAVVESSLIIAKDFEVNLNMVYTVAVFHDVGLVEGRKNHHIIGGEMLKNDNFINNFFSISEIKIMQEAVEDHRASTTNKPRSIYGLIISEADLFDEADKIIERSFLFRISKGEEDFDKLYEEVRKHIEEKYGNNGYLKSWLESKRVLEMLEKLQNLLEDKVFFKKYCYNIYQRINK